MNTITPTGDGVTGVPDWLPDEELLARMANEFFATWPGSEPAVAAPAVPAVQPAAASATEPAAARSSRRVAAVQPAAIAAVQRAGPSFYFLDYLPPGTAPTAPTATVQAGGRQPVNVEAIRRQFPILSERINGRRSSGWTMRPRHKNRRWS